MVRFEKFFTDHSKAIRDALLIVCYPCVGLLICCFTRCGTRTKCVYENPPSEEEFRKKVRASEPTFRKLEEIHNRRRSLSVPAPEASKSRFGLPRKPKDYHQPQSMFFSQLPLEIREAIYMHVLCSEPYLHLQLDGNRFSIPDCEDFYERHEIPEEIPGVVLGHMICVHNHGGYRRTRAHRSTRERRSRYMFLPLLRTCRKTYVEAIDLFYSRNTFELRIGYDIVIFIRSIPARYSSSIKSLHLHVARFEEEHWRETMTVLKKMPSLMRCHIIMRGYYSNAGPPQANVSYLRDRVFAEGLVEDMKILSLREALVILLAYRTAVPEPALVVLLDKWIVKDMP